MKASTCTPSMSGLFVLSRSLVMADIGALPLRVNQSAVHSKSRRGFECRAASRSRKGGPAGLWGSPEAPGVSFLNHSAGRFSDSCRQPADASGSCLRHHEALGKAAVHVTTWRARA